MRAHHHLALIALLASSLACPSRAAAPAGETAPPRQVFGPVKAGSWYPGDGAALKQQLHGFLAQATPSTDGGRVVALISPHAGYQWSGTTAAFGYKLLQGQSYRRVIVLGPSHSSGFAGFSVLDASHYRTPLGEIPLDLDAARTLRQHADHHDDPAAWQREHSLEMQLPFLQQVLGEGFQLLPVMVGPASTPQQLARLAAALKQLADAQTLVVVSSDFTHYGASFSYLPFADQVAHRLEHQLARPAFAAIASADPAAFAAYLEQTRDTICGRKPIEVLMRMQPRATPRLLKYETSGRQTGDYASSVSYLSIAYRTGPGTAPSGGGGDVAETPAVAATQPATGKAPSPKAKFQPAPSELSQAEKTLLLKIARASLSQHLRQDGSLDKLLAGAAISKGLKLARGAFVTINKKPRPGQEHGELRGCIGYMAQQDPLHQLVARLAIQSGTQDRRFTPMTAAELDDVFFEISILSPMQPVNSWRDIVIGLHGMTLAKDGRRAVFLPQVAPDWGWDRDTTLTQLSKKAGLPGDAWKTGARFEVFTADVFEEPLAH